MQEFRAAKLVPPRFPGWVEWGECAVPQYTRIIVCGVEGVEREREGAAAAEVIGLTLYYIILIIVRADHHADFN